MSHKFVRQDYGLNVSMLCICFDFVEFVFGKAIKTNETTRESNLSQFFFDCFPSQRCATTWRKH